MYILKEGKVTQCKDVREWAKFFEDIKNRDVALTDVGDCYVSTVFLGIDHSFGEGPPLLFETMVFLNRQETRELFGRKFKFNPSFEEYTTRYETLEQAKRGHLKIVNKLKSKLRVVK